MIYAIAIGLMFLCRISCEKMPVLREKGAAFSRKTVVLASFTILFLISSFRDYRVGIDTLNYIRKFSLIQNYTFRQILSGVYTERVEFGYALLNRLCGIVFGHPRSILIVSSAIVCYGMAHYICRYTDYGLEAVILFTCCGLFLDSLNITRQTMACVMMVNAWGALTHKTYGKSAAWFLAGISLHITSVVFSVVYFFYFFRGSRRVVILSFLASLVPAVFFRPILRFASEFVNAFRYFDNADAKIHAGGIWLLWAVELLMAAFFLVSWLSGKRKESWLMEADRSCVPIFVVYYIVFTFLGTKFNYLNRFGIYFLPFLIPLFLNLGKILKHSAPLYDRLYRIGWMAGFIGYFLLSAGADQYQYAFGW